jgi:hypothetical protein
LALSIKLGDDLGDAQEAEAKKKQREAEEAKAEAASREREAQAREQMEMLRQAQKKVYEKVRRLPPVDNPCGTRGEPHQLSNLSCGRAPVVPHGASMVH